MKIINSFLLAFAMYSRIPVPKTEWNADNMKYSMIFFPFVGAVIAALLFAWHSLSSCFGKLIPSEAEALIALSIPVFISGGIHLDGFMDTSDALSSHQGKKRKLEIMKDSNTGAFAVINLALYFALFFAAYLILLKSRTEYGIFALGFVLSRILSGMGVVFFKSAKSDGLLYTFADSAELTTTRAFLAAEFIVCEAAMIHINPIGAFVTLLLNLIFMFFYYKMTEREFGGITGDTCGWFSSNSELISAYGAALGVIITKGIMKI